MGWLLLAQNQDWAERALLALAEPREGEGRLALSFFSWLSLRLPVLLGLLRGPAEWTTQVCDLGTRLGPAEPRWRQASAVVGSAGPEPPPFTALTPPCWSCTAEPSSLSSAPDASLPPPQPAALPASLHAQPHLRGPSCLATMVALSLWGAWSTDTPCAASQLTWTPLSPAPSMLFLLAEGGHSRPWSSRPVA